MTTNHPPILADEPDAQDGRAGAPDNVPAHVGEGIQDIRTELEGNAVTEDSNVELSGTAHGDQLTIFDAEDTEDLLDLIDAPADPKQPKRPELPRQKAHPNLLDGGVAKRNRKPKALNGQPQTEQELAFDRESDWNSTKILASLARWAIANTKHDKRSYELVVLLYLIGHKIGWDPNKDDYLSCTNVTHNSISEAISCSDSSVKRALRGMKERGLLTWEYVHWKGRGQRKCNRYRLLGTGAVMEGSFLPFSEPELKSLQVTLSERYKKPTGHISSLQVTLSESLQVTLSEILAPFLRSINKNTSYQRKNARTANAEIPDAEKPKSVKNEAVRKANKASRDSSDNPITLDDLPIELRSYAQTCIGFFENAHADRDTLDPIDWQGLDKNRKFDESWVFRVTLRDPRQVYERLESAKAKCGGKPLYRGVILSAVGEVRDELDADAEFTEEEREANKKRLNEILGDAFGGGQAPDEPDPVTQPESTPTEGLALDDPAFAEYAQQLAEARGWSLEAAFRHLARKYGASGRPQKKR